MCRAREAVPAGIAWLRAWLPWAVATGAGFYMTQQLFGAAFMASMHNEILELERKGVQSQREPSGGSSFPGWVIFLWNYIALVGDFLIKEKSPSKQCFR